VSGVPTVPRRFLGDAIRRLRLDSGKTLDEAAGVIGKSRVQLIRVIDGKGTISAQELAALLDFLGADPVEKRELLALGVEARKRSTRRAYTDLLPNGFLRIADLEAMAVEIWNYTRGVIPAPLQTSAYVEAQMAIGDGIWWDPSWEERRNRIDFRLARQRQIMAAEPAKTMRFVISAEALRTEVGNPEVMVEQLTYLVKIIDENPNISIQVIPSTAANNPAPEGGLILLHFREPLRPVGFIPVAYGPSTYLDEPADTHRLSRAFRRLQGLALDAETSRDLIVADLATREPVDDP
jgi:transcriptional regulator with XRE-family HTH domain